MAKFYKKMSGTGYPTYLVNISRGKMKDAGFLEDDNETAKECTVRVEGNKIIIEHIEPEEYEFYEEF